MIVALDTVILAHYSDHTNSQPHDALNAIRAECSQLFDAIIERDGMVDIVIPAPVIAEFTAVIRNPVPRRQMAEAFARSQVVYPLDFSTCSLAGELAGALRHSGN